MGMTIKKLILFIGVLGTSLSAVFVHLSAMPQFALVLYRTGFATLLLLPAFWRHRKELSAANPKLLLLSMLSGMFLALHFAAYFTSLRYTSVSAATVLVDTEVFFVAGFLWVFLHRGQPRRALWGILLAFVGSIVIGLGDQANGTNPFFGNIMALLGAAAMSGYTLLGMVCRKTISTTVYTFFVYFSCALCALLMTLASGLPLAGYDSQSVLAALALAVFSTILGHSIYSWALRYFNPAYVSTVKLAEPIFSTTAFFLLFGQIPTLAAVVGGCLVLLGIGIFTLVKETNV